MNRHEIQPCPLIVSELEQPNLSNQALPTMVVDKDTDSSSLSTDTEFHVLLNLPCQPVSPDQLSQDQVQLNSDVPAASVPAKSPPILRRSTTSNKGKTPHRCGQRQVAGVNEMNIEYRDTLFYVIIRIWLVKCIIF